MTWKDEVKAEATGGGGIIALVTVEHGYKVFASLPQDETWFPYASGDEVGKKAAKDEATKLKIATGARLDWGFTIKAAAEGALSRGEPVSWQVDTRHFYSGGWTDAFKGVVGPSLEEHSIENLPWSGWARIGFADDPYGTVELDQNDEERVKQVAYLVEVFASEAEAKAGLEVAEVVPGFDDLPPIPSAWKDMPDQFKVAVAEIKAKVPPGPPPVMAGMIKLFIEENHPDGLFATVEEVMAWLPHVSPPKGEDV